MPSHTGPNKHGARKNKPKSKILNTSMKEYQKFLARVCSSSLPDKQFSSKNIHIGQPCAKTTNNLVAKGGSKLHHVSQSKGVTQKALSRLKANGKDKSKETCDLERKRYLVDVSQPTHLTAMPGLLPKPSVRLGQCGDSSSRIKKQASSDKGEVITSAISKGIYMVPKDNCSTEGNERQDEIAIDKEIDNEVEYKEGETAKTKHTLDSKLSDMHCNSESISLDSFGKDLPKFRRDKEVTFDNVEKRGFTERNMGQFANSKKRKGLLFEENPTALEDDDMSCKQVKKLEQSNVSRKHEAKGGNGNLNHVGVEDDTISISKNDHVEVSVSCVERQFRSCSKPIDKPTWSGIFKTDDKKYVSLDGHLSTKSCQKAWCLSTQLLKVVEVKKLSRLEVWPKAWEVSAPTSDNIGIYFFPHEMMQDEGLDQLVREVMVNDLSLQTILGEAEMLIFPSILLPNHHQTFQRKPYLWGVFKRRQDRGDVVEEPLNVVGPEKEKQQNLLLDQLNPQLPSKESNQEMIQMAGAMPLERHMLSRSTQEVEANRLKGPTNKGFDLKAPGEEGGQAEATPVAKNVVAFSASHEHVNRYIGRTADRLMSFVVWKTQKVERIIRELEGEGALVFAMQGEMVGSWAGSNATATQK